MKKISILLILAVSMLMSSCWKDYEVASDGLAAFTITPTIPNDNYSFVDASLFDLRYTLEVWTTDSPAKVAYRHAKTVDVSFFGEGAERPTFTAKLPMGNYDFVIWADYVPQGTTEDFHYKTDNNTGLRDISIITPYGVSDNSRDAYFSTVRDVKIAGRMVKASAKLQSPFAKLRTINRDVAIDKIPQLAQITFPEGVTLPRGFDAFAGEPTATTQSLTEWYSSTPVKGDQYIVMSKYLGTATYKNAYRLSFDYIFASSSNPQTIEMGLRASRDTGMSDMIYTYKVENILLQPNSLYTLVLTVGSTTTSVLGVMSDPYLTKDIEIVSRDAATAEELRTHLTTSASIKMTSVINTNETFVIPEYRADPDNISLDFRKGVNPANTITIDANTNQYRGIIHICIAGDKIPENFIITSLKAKVLFYNATGKPIEYEGSIDAGQGVFPPSMYEPEL